MSARDPKASMWGMCLTDKHTPAADGLLLKACSTEMLVCMAQSIVYMLWALGRMSGWNDVDAKMQSRVFQPLPPG